MGVGQRLQEKWRSAATATDNLQGSHSARHSSSAGLDEQCRCFGAHDSFRVSHPSATAGAVSSARAALSEF